MANKRKTTTAIVAGVTAVALLLGGTFAWTSISQQAKNETAGVVNVGGRLHDDFNGTNKDIYVENFTDPLDGGQPIYARIKLTEYMEVGQDAGGFGVDVDGDGKTEVVPVVENTDINDVSTWTAHVPAESCAICATEGTCKIHDHWKWIMGGEEGDGSTIFMPTFNKDKDSLAADINGTYHGTDNTDKVYYDDYVVYTTDENGLANVPQAEIAAQDGEILSVDGTAYYDDDPTHDENDHDNNIGAFRTEPETHTAKKTAIATVMTMQAWKDAGSQPGNFWVYDTDGWAYWANPIMPGESTGLLLDGIEMFQNPGEKCYYSINVVGQFATVNDWEYFTDGEPSADAQNLLKIASDNVTTVTVTNNGATTLGTTMDEEAGITNTTTFTATAVKASDGTSATAESEFTWAIYDTDLNPVDTSTITQDGVLTIGESEKNANLIIAATHVESGAVGLASVAIDSPVVTYRLAVSSTDEYYQDLGGLSLESDYTVTLTANDKPLTISEVVSVEVVGNSNSYTDELSKFAGSATLQDDGTVLLTVGAQDKEFGTGTYAWNDWKIIKLTVKDSEGTEYSRPLLINAGTVTYNQMVFRNMDGSLATVIDPSYVVNNLTINTMYTFEPGLYSQSQNFWNNYLDSVWFDDSWTVTAYEYDSENYEAGAEATSVTIKDNTIIFAEAGEYVIEAVKDGYETVRSNVTVMDEFGIMVNDIYSAYSSISTDNVSTVSIDGIDWYVLALDEATEGEEKALLFAKNSVEKRAFDADSARWQGSDLETYLNGDWLNNHSTINQYAIPIDITFHYNENETVNNRVFVLSDSDFTVQDQWSDFTYGNTYIVPLGIRENFTEQFWLRTCWYPDKYPTDICVGRNESTSDTAECTAELSVQPAFWISLNSDYSAN